MAIHMATIYHSKKLQRKVRKGKRHRGQVQEDQANFQSLLPVESHGTCSIPPARSSHHRCEESPGEAHGDPAPRVLSGDWSCRHSAPHGPRFQTPGGEQVLSETVCANSVSPGNHSYQGQWKPS